MKKKDVLQQLVGFVKDNPKWTGEVIKLAEEIKNIKKEEIDIFTICEICGGNSDMFKIFYEQLISCGAEDAKVFPVYDDIPPEIKERLHIKDAHGNYANWKNTIKALPKYTSPLQKVDSEYIAEARSNWQKNICGNDEILKVVLRHGIEYSRTGKTSPILLLGPPGIGKSAVANQYGDMLKLPGVSLSGPSASTNRGLSGSPNLYAGAGAGAIVQSMVDTGTGNPVICIDEIEKNAAVGRSGSPAFW